MLLVRILEMCLLAWLVFEVTTRKIALKVNANLEGKCKIVADYRYHQKHAECLEDIAQHEQVTKLGVVLARIIGHSWIIAYSLLHTILLMLFDMDHKLGHINHFNSFD